VTPPSDVVYVPRGVTTVPFCGSLNAIDVTGAPAGMTLHACNMFWRITCPPAPRAHAPDDHMSPDRAAA